MDFFVGKKVGILFFLIIFTVLVAILSGVYTEQAEASMSSNIDALVFEVKNEHVEVATDNLIVSLYVGEGDPLYDYISGSKIIGIASESDYYDFDSYVEHFYMYEDFDDIKAEADELDPAIVENIKLWPISEVIGIKSVDNIEVDFGTDYDNIPFPEKVEVELFNIKESNEYHGFVNIDWEVEAKPEYRAEDTGVYTFEGKLELPKNIIDPDASTAFVEIAVKGISGSGTAKNPYIIHTFSGLEKLLKDNYNLDAYYELGANIDASPTKDRFYNDGEGWEPVGDSDEAFTGNFDGKGYEISNLYIDRPEQRDVGLFGVVEDANINNLDLVRIEYLGASNVGGLAGKGCDNIIENIFVSGEIENTATGGNAGGLIGSSENSLISECHAEAEILGSGRDIGGLIGEVFGNDHEIKRSSASGDVYSTRYGERVGGLIGSSSGIRSTIKDSHANGNVYGTKSSIGGLIGENKNTFIKNNYATGNVHSKEHYSGGLIGRNIEADIEDSYSIGNVEGDRDNTRRFGGLVGFNTDGDIFDSYSEGEIEGRQSGGGLIGTNDGGKISNSSAYGNVKVHGNNAGGLIGSNDEGDIIGSYSKSDVEGSRKVGGLIGTNDNGDIIDSNFKGNIKGLEHIGGLIGINSGLFKIIKNSYAKGNIIGYDNNIGGLIGKNEETSIKNSYAEVNVGGDKDNTLRFGGLVGWNIKSDITNSYSAGKVEGRQQGGGLIGLNDGGDINSVYTLAEVVVHGNYGGGLIGDNKAGSIANSYSKSNVEASRIAGGLIGRNFDNIMNSYSVGEVKGKDIGGLIANNNGDVTSSFWDMNVGIKFSDGGEGKTTSEMKIQKTYINWNFNDIWNIDEGSSYPYFQWQVDKNAPVPPDN